MYKLIIVDDEPLVQVGIKSMLNWGDLDIELCGIAMNGQAALQMMEQQLPDIVITDIKMPIMSGLELIRLCRERYGNEHPAFIILTSYEDFQIAKEALRYQVTDYLVKIELTADNLRSAIERVLKQASLQKTQQSASTSYMNMQALYDKFFIRLLNNLFDSPEQFRLQSNELNLTFTYPYYLCSYLEMINGPSTAPSDSSAAAVKASSEAFSGKRLPAVSGVKENREPGDLPRGQDISGYTLEKQANLFSSTLQMLREIMVKYIPCHIVSLDLKHCAIIFCCREEQFLPETAKHLQTILSSVSETLKKYYNVTLKGGIGAAVSEPLDISDSYQYARQAASYVTARQPILYIEDCGNQTSQSNLFNISLFKDALCRSFEELDADTFYETLTEIIALFRTHPGHYVQALDGACNILYLSISLLPNGEDLITQIFESYPDNYRSIYKQSTVEQIADWLTYFRDQLQNLFLERRKEHKNHIVTSVKRYIAENITERLTLNEVAAVFGISPNYLSQLFKKYNDMGFSEYITALKVKEAKILLADTTYKVYEIADMLGFESAFYFSKVFKKVEGISPSEYQNQKVM